MLPNPLLALKKFPKMYKISPNMVTLRKSCPELFYMLSNRACQLVLYSSLFKKTIILITIKT